MEEQRCFIWNTPSREFRPFDGMFHVDSPRAGGRYAIDEMAVDILNQKSTDDKILLTTWLCDQRQAGMKEPVVRREVIDGLKVKAQLTTSERVVRVLLFFGETIRLGQTMLMYLGEFTDADPDASRLAAVSASSDKDDLEALIILLVEMNLLRDTTQELGRFGWTPTSDGWLKIEELTRRQKSASQAFVAMWFNETTQEPFENGFYKAILHMGYDPKRIDQQHHHLNKVDDEIIAEIRRSRFLIADFTCEPGKVRGGVYFEAGFALGLDIPIIWTCKETSMSDLHFDTRQYPHIVWKDSSDLYKQLKARIGALIGDGPKLPS